MPYDLNEQTENCTVCGSPSNQTSSRLDTLVDCVRCGDFQISRATLDDMRLPYHDPKDRALASYIIRKMQAPRTRLQLTIEFFNALQHQTLPTPAEAIDNLIIWLAEQADGRPGKDIEFAYSDPMLRGIVGVVGPEDIQWIVTSLHSQQLLIAGHTTAGGLKTKLTASGWRRYEALKRAHISSRYAFFARRFNNSDLDQVFVKCLRPAVEKTGYELRAITQRGGLVDAVIEDEIRRCRFLIADLSDDNAGAYWEAGFAEGLGKPVIYVCCATKDGEPKRTHFDANHRHTVRWGLNSFDQTAANLKAVIRNTLLGDAKQTD